MFGKFNPMHIFFLSSLMKAEGMGNSFKRKTKEHCVDFGVGFFLNPLRKF